LLVVCVADERYPVALERAEHYLERHPTDVDMKFATASIHIAVDNLTRATLLLQEVVRERPQWPDAHYALATVLRQQGDASQRADVHDLEYLRLEPDGPLAERVRARLSRFGE
jgi:predicted Zn-dependent protease